jgi:hypothetical protein
MFTSEKELRKVPPKRVGGSVSKRDDKNEIIERVRKEREQRKSDRETFSFAVKIQKFWRGRHYGNITIQVERLDFDKKIEDIAKVAQFLKLTKSIDFVAPPSTCLCITRKLMFGKFSPFKVYSYCM